MGLIATLLGVLVVSTPVPVTVCDVQGCRHQVANRAEASCGVTVLGSVRKATTTATRPTWRVTAWRQAGLVESVRWQPSTGVLTTTTGPSAYAHTGLVFGAVDSGTLIVHSETLMSGVPCVTDTIIELRAGP